MPGRAIYCLKGFKQTCTHETPFSFLYKLDLKVDRASFQLNLYIKNLEQNLASPLIISIAFVALTRHPSMTSSNKRSSGSQRAEWLAPWHGPAKEDREPKAITAWNFCSEVVLYSRDKTVEASEVN